MEKIKVIFLCLLILLISSSQSFGAKFMEPWADIWTNVAQYETNAEKMDFKSIVGRVEARIGIHLLPLWGETTLKPYFAYLGVSSQDNAYWNNSGASGGGVRFKPFLGYRANAWYDEWIKDLRIFGEVLSITYYSEKEKAESEGKPVTDTRAGLDLWHEWNQFRPEDPTSTPNPALPWAEVWANLSYRTTNFYEEEFNDFIFYLQPKIGVQSDILDTGASIEPYLRMDLVLSGKGKEYAWLNHIDYGAGIRVRPFKQGNFFGNNLPWLSKLKIFAEMISISWTKGKDYETRPDTDFRFGIDFTYGR